MPIISQFYGIIISMHYRENDRHKLPHLHAEYGECDAVYDLESNKIIVRAFNKQTRWCDYQEINIEHAANTNKGGHSGGDVGLMHDLLAYLNGEGSSVSLTTLNDSIYGHLCVYAAEEARKTLSVVPLTKL